MREIGSFTPFPLQISVSRQEQMPQCGCAQPPYFALLFKAPSLIPGGANRTKLATLNLKINPYANDRLP
jgi:hypothetical protein